MTYIPQAAFSPLSGTTWDVSTNPKATKALTGNTALTITNTINGIGYMIYVTQTGAGGYTISINGTDVDINDTGTTLIGVVDVGGDLAFCTNKGNAPATPYTTIVFDDLVNISQYQTNRYKNNSPGSGWLSGGRDTVHSIPANTDFVVLRKYVASEGQTSYLGLTLTNTTHYDTFPNLLIGVGGDDTSTANNVVKLTGTSQVALAATLTNWYGIRRVGSVWSFVQSDDGENFTTLGISSVTTTAAVYFAIICYDNAAAVIDTPKYKLL